MIFLVLTVKLLLYQAGLFLALTVHLQMHVRGI